MRILVFIKDFAGPTLTFIYNEVTELAKKHEVKIITCERKNEDIFPFGDVVEIPFLENKLRLKYQTKAQYLDIRIAFRSSYFRKKINTIVDNFKPNVIHTHFGFESWLFLENFKRSDIPIFVSFHGYDASHKLTSERYRIALKRYLNRPEVTPIFVSNYMKHHVESKAGEFFEKAKILYYGTDIDFFQRADYKQNQRHFLFLQVSSFAEKKGHEFTLRAFASLVERLKKEKPDTQLKLVLAGEGLLRKSTEALAEQLGIKAYVEFVGLVTKNETKNLMEKADAFVHHSVTSASVGDMEGIPNAIMEAMAMELPILSTTHSGIPELVEDGTNGFLVKERDVVSYAEKMHEILAWKYISKNREKVAQLFEKKRHAVQLAEFYEEVVIS